jgi:hypothetical protein
MFVVTTGFRTTVAMGTEVSRVSIGRDTVIGGGVGVGCAEATPLISKEAVVASASWASAWRRRRADECNLFFAKVEKTEVDEICILDSPASWVSLLRGSNFFVSTRRIGCILLIFLKKKTKHPHPRDFFIRCAASMTAVAVKTFAMEPGRNNVWSATTGFFAAKSA